MKHKTARLLALSALTALSLNLLAAPQPADAGTKRLESLGSLAIPEADSAWARDQRNGLIALMNWRLDEAEAMLRKAIDRAKNYNVSESRLVQSRLGLARLYLMQDRLAEAHRIYSMTRGSARSSFGSHSAEAAECEIGLARCLVAFKKADRALKMATRAEKSLRELGETESELYGLALQALALVDAEHGWHQEAEKHFKESRLLLKQHPGFQGLNFARALRTEALYYHSRGRRGEAGHLYEWSFRIQERVVSAQHPASLVGQVDLRWEPGSTRAREIVDSEFPFRYLSAGGVRVAATVVDLWELLGVLVTVTNVSDSQQEIVLGNPKLINVDANNKQFKPRVIKAVDSSRIDVIRRERNMWDLTHTRPWLANIQKTRTVRGLVPPSGHDLFRGPNVFGPYGKWKAVSHIVPARLSVMPSRERITYIGGRKKVRHPGLLNHGHSQLRGTTSVILEPFESRTGELFYLNPRDKDVVLKVPAGNAVFHIPFHTRKKRIP